MKTFNQYLTEIGDSRKPYPFKMVYGTPEYRGFFTADSGLKYVVSALHAGQRFLGLEIVYRVNSKSSDNGFKLTNAGMSNAFRIMATVIAFTKKTIIELKKREDITVTRIRFKGAGYNKFGENDSKKNQQRLKLYMQFAKKEMMVKRIRKEGTLVVIDL